MCLEKESLKLPCSRASGCAFQRAERRGKMSLRHMALSKVGETAIEEEWESQTGLLYGIPETFTTQFCRETKHGCTTPRLNPSPMTDPIVPVGRAGPHLILGTFESSDRIPSSSRADSDVLV